MSSLIRHYKMRIAGVDESDAREDNMIGLGFLSGSTQVGSHLHQIAFEIDRLNWAYLCGYRVLE